MNSKEREYIEWIIDRSDTKHHEAAIKYLFYGKESVTRTIRSVVLKYFSNNKYSLVRSEVYPTFVSVFYQYLLTINPQKLREIDNLNAYFFKAVSTFLIPGKPYRIKIDASLGIDATHVEFNPNVFHEESFTSEEFDNPNENDGKESESTAEDDSNDDFGEDDKSPVDPDDWTAFVMLPYIQQIEGKNRDRTIEDLFSKVIEDLPSKDYAELIGTNYRDVDVRRGRALVEVLKVALPDIRKRAKKMFVRFKDCLNSSQVKILQDFFDTGEPGDDKQQKKIAEAYKTLLVKANSAHRTVTQPYIDAIKREKERAKKEEDKKGTSKKDEII